MVAKFLGPMVDSPKNIYPIRILSYSCLVIPIMELVCSGIILEVHVWASLTAHAQIACMSIDVQ